MLRSDLCHYSNALLLKELLLFVLDAEPIILETEKIDHKHLKIMHHVFLAFQK